jgi:hypothetical protein
MNTQAIARHTSGQWLCRGIAIVGALLISGAVILGLANRAAGSIAPAAAPAVNSSAAQEHFAAFKQRQAEQVADVAMPLLHRSISARARYMALKERQLEAHDISEAPVPTPISARARYMALKDRQAEMRESRPH